MAARNLGTLTVDLIAKVGGFTQGMTEAERVADRKSREMQRKLNQRAKAVEKAWIGMGTALAAGIGGIGIAFGAVLGKVITETKNAEREQALLAAALKATGSQAGYSQARLNEMAGAMETLTGIAGGEFNQAQTVLLGFTNIVGEQLPKALQAAADFSVRTGTSMASAAETMGRALDVPSAGMASLAKQGFKFSESQIEAARQLEKTGRIAEAQQIVLDALDETYGGAAVAARDTFGGALQALQGTINALMTGDSGSLDQAKKAINELTSTLSSPSTKESFDTLMGWVVGLTNTIVTAAANMIAFTSTADKLGALTGTDAFGKMKDRAKDAAYELTRLTSEYTRMREQQANDPSNAKLNAKVEAWEARIKSARKEVENASDALKTFSDGFKPPKVSAVVAPDLTTRTVGPVNLKDGDKPKGGKSQTEKDADAAQRFLQSMRDQAFKAQERTAYEKLFFDIQNKGLKLSVAQLGQAEGVATAIDMAKEAERARSAELDKQNTLYQLQERLMGVQQRNQLEMLTYGMGDQAAQEMRDRIAMQQQQQAELRQMQHEHGQELRKAETEDKKLHLQALFEDRYRLTQEALAQELRLFDDAAKQKQAKEKDWLAGAKAGMDTYARDAANAYEQSKQLAQSAFQGMENALLDFATTGKLNFKSFAASVISDLIRIQIRAAMAGVLGNALGSMGDMLGMSVGGTYGPKTQAGLDNLISSSGWSGGGYTGPGGKYDPAGIVHRGEGVLSQDDMSALGGPRAFEAFRASLHRGYASGGVVGAAATAAAPTGGAGLEVHVHNNAGTQVEQRQRTGPDGKAILDIFINEAAAQVAGGYGPMGQAMRQRERMGG